MRCLLLRKRADLSVERHRYLGREYWVVKDPVAQKYYRFEEEEFALLEMLDGETSLEELQVRFERRFAPQRITLAELHQLVGMLHRSCLAVSDAAGQGRELLQRGRKRAHRERLAALTNILSIRFKGVDPNRLLTWLDKRLGWFFSPTCASFCGALALAALMLITVQFEVFRAKLPAFQEFFGTQNWVWLAITLALTKVLHEFGHGLACKRCGGECHEMGVMLLVLTPCLYCNVSDSWMLPSKWRRAAIGAAGMYVEVVLASICTFLWWFTQPGLLNYLCLNVMFVCSVSTLLFNANPLMRYDGYYILSDLIEIPNLRQKATTIMHRKLGSWLLGLPEPPDPFLPQRRQVVFAGYAVAAVVYRWLVMLGILWFLYQVFEPYGLQVVGQMIACMALYGMVVQPIWRLVKFFAVPGRIDRVKTPRLVVSAAVFGVLIGGVFCLPLPHYVRCELYIQPRQAQAAYVEFPGQVHQVHVSAGDWVRAGDALVTLENLDVQIELARLFGQLEQQRTKLNSLRQRAFEDESAAVAIAEIEETITALQQQLARRQEHADGLRIEAPTDGCVIAPPQNPRNDSASGQLPSWSGSPLDRHNLRATLDEGVLVCHVGDPARLEAILAIDQADVEFVHAGQAVDILIEPLPGRRLHSKLVQLSQLEMTVSPDSLSGKTGGGLATRTDIGGRERPASTTYQASASLDDEFGEMFVGATGRARIHAGTRTIANRAWRFVCQTFSFDV